ncbi:MAG TPA: HEAT repeat domain-containing protein [Polyangia bacterium]
MRLCPYLLCALLAAAPACNDADDDIRANVTLLCNHEGALATAAAEHLTRYGRRAIPTIEAAMHTASPTGKKNLILALRKIGDVEAVPLLGHVAQFEPNADVRREAEWTLRQWADDGKAPERAARAKQSLRVLEEARGTEDAG